MSEKKIIGKSSVIHATCQIFINLSTNVDNFGSKLPENSAKQVNYAKNGKKTGKLIHNKYKDGA